LPTSFPFLHPALQLRYSIFPACRQAGLFDIQYTLFSSLPALVSNLPYIKKKHHVESDISQMANVEIEQQIVKLEEQYADSLQDHADVHKLSSIWRRIKDLKHELQKRTEKT
jgi:hypothetical protein